ncbi:geranylgeranylglycerol-phosphate geranylgeranyltransferase [bacterium]|nr:geranylgeranylglycerol-phosphate geranylgeranyltransferase [bacterium]
MLKSFFTLVRVGNLLLAVFSVLAGYFLAAGPFNITALLGLVLSVGFIFMSGNVLNDYYDVDIDRVNRPERPIASGKVKVGHALILGLVLLILGIVTSALISYSHLIMAIGCGFLLVAYNAYLKRVPFWGNFTIAFLGGLVFIYTGFARIITPHCWFAAIFAFLIHFGREMIKDIEDMHGDVTYGAETMPIRLGVKFTKILFTISVVILIIATIVPYIIKVFSLVYLIIMVFLVDTLLIYIILKTIYASEKKDYSRISLLLKLDIVFGLIALFTSKISV